MEGKHEVAAPLEMLNAENKEVKLEAIRIANEFASAGASCHDTNCIVGKEHMILGLCKKSLLDGMRALRHTCSKALWRPFCNQDHLPAACNRQAAEQLWSRLDKLRFAANFSRRRYRQFSKHARVCRNKYVARGTIKSDSNPRISRKALQKRK